MKSWLAMCSLFVCVGVRADLESTSQKLSTCTMGYAESQINTSLPAHSISEAALKKCASELSNVHDSIGPDEAQWEKLDGQQKQAISNIRDQTITKIREQLSTQIVSFVTEERKGS